MLQAGVVVGSGSASFEMIRHLTDRLPVMTTPKWVHNKIQPIAIRDVLHYLVAAATAAVPKSRTWDIGGPDVLEYGDMMQIYAEVAGLRPRHMLVLPVLTPRIAALWVGLVTPIPSGLARPLVESLHCDAVMNNHDIDTIIPPPPGGLTPVPTVGVAGAGPHRPRRGGDDVEHRHRRATAQRPGVGRRGRLHRHPLAAHRSSSPEQLWKAVEGSIPDRWQVEEREPGSVFGCAPQNGGPGERWLEMRVSPGGQRQPLRAAGDLLSARAAGPGVLVRRTAGAGDRLDARVRQGDRGGRLRSRD